MGITAFAEVNDTNPSNLIQQGDSGGEEIPTVIDAVYGESRQQPIVQKAYEVTYLLEATNESILGLDTMKGSGDVGSTIEISQPQVEGYQVLENQPNNLVISEDEELNKVVVYYKVVEAVVQGVTLTVNHTYYLNDKETTEVQVINDLKEGTVINPAEYLLDRDDLEFASSDKESLTISGVNPNEINIYYNGIVKEEKQPIEAIDSPMTMLKSMGLFAATAALEPNDEPGAIFINKTAEWVDEANGIAKIIIDINGNPIQTKGADVVLVLDTSRSMDGTKLQNTKIAAKAFVTELYKANGSVTSDNRIAIVKFANTVSKYPNVGSNKEKLLSVNNSVSGQTATNYFNAKIDGLMAGGNTNYNIAFTAASEIINGRIVKTRPTYIVFMSDGEPYPYASRNGQSIATTLKNAGTKIYSLGLGLTGNSFTNYIEPLASTPKTTYAKSISATTDLTPIFTGIAGEIKIAGTNAVVTDFIQTNYFHVTTKPGQSYSYEASHGTAIIAVDGEVTWNVGDITATKKTLTIYIQLNASITQAGNYDTNIGASVVYTDYNNSSQTKVYPKPSLDVGNQEITSLEQSLLQLPPDLIT